MSQSLPLTNKRIILTQATIFIISDGTGETAATIIRAALVQYDQTDINITRYKNIRNDSQIDSIIDDAFDQQALILHTMVSPSLRKHITSSCSEKGLVVIDILGPLLNGLDTYLGNSDSPHQAGLLRAVDEKYYKRIEAIEFTVKRDDGKCLANLEEADIILVGISRTSKTPLSIFLSHKGWKVVNIPIVLNTPLPEELFAVDQRKIIGLIIEPDHLKKFRSNRLQKFGQDPGGEYASYNYINKEIDYSMSLFKENRRWPVFNITERALEETATEITRIVSSRTGLPDGVIF